MCELWKKTHTYSSEEALAYVTDLKPQGETQSVRSSTNKGLAASLHQVQTLLCTICQTTKLNLPGTRCLFRKKHS